MACFTTGGHNCFGPYYPCQVWTSVSRCDSNTVVNPVIVPNFAFFTLASSVTVTSGGVVPLALVSSSGTAITLTTVGEITLAVGTYAVNYNISSILGASGSNSFGLTLNGVTIPASVTSVTGSAGDSASLSNSVIITVTSPSALRIVNLGTDAVVVNMANLFVQKLS